MVHFIIYFKKMNSFNQRIYWFIGRTIVKKRRLANYCYFIKKKTITISIDTGVYYFAIPESRFNCTTLLKNVAGLPNRTSC
jgi:hypothetical protein